MKVASGAKPTTATIAKDANVVQSVNGFSRPNTIREEILEYHVSLLRDISPDPKALTHNSYLFLSQGAVKEIRG